jgi:hypothetical protein
VLIEHKMCSMGLRIFLSLFCFPNIIKGLNPFLSSKLDNFQSSYSILHYLLRIQDSDLSRIIFETIFQFDIIMGKYVRNIREIDMNVK